MSGRTPAQRLALVNIVLISICSLLLLVCLVRQLWFPALAFSVLILSNGYQLVTGRRT